MSAEPLLDLSNVSAQRGGREVLHGITLRIAAGEHVAILGPNGCGKSTLLKTITRELYPLALPGAHLKILGAAVWNVFELRRLLGIVTNDLVAQCTRDISAQDIVLSGFFSSIGLWPHHAVSPAMREQADRLLKALDAEALRERRMTELSSGEVRRIVIARALVHDPKALILDEPSNSLDLAAQHDLHKTMRGLAQRGLGIILVTHFLPDIIPEIGRIILLKDGRVIGDGLKREILATERLRGLFGADIQVFEKDGWFNAW
jgi:iron complex transport system ATP-binding protein